MFIDLGDYNPYTDAIKDVSEAKINVEITFCHGFPFSFNKGNMITWINKDICEVFNNCFTTALTLVKYQKAKMCNSCQFSEDILPQSNEDTDVPMKKRYNFSQLYFTRTPIVNVKSIEI